MKLLWLVVVLSLSTLSGLVASETYYDNVKAQQLIQELVREEHMDKKQLEMLFSELTRDDKVLHLMLHAPEKTADWEKYSRIFLNDKRIEMGKSFLKTHKKQLDAAVAQYQVPQNIIAAILGIETYYGRQTGNHKVIRSLATLAFDHPSRHKFFRSELKHFLLLIHQQNLDAMKLTGSYAGAMGYPQFMPSSYVRYAVDFDEDEDIDIWGDATDSIGSIAHYLSKFGWVQKLPIAYQVHPENVSVFKTLADNNPKPLFSSEQLQLTGLKTDLYPTIDNKYSLLALTSVEPEEYWIGTENFYVISRYNPSYLYTMAVLRLAQLIDPLSLQQ